MEKLRVLDLFSGIGGFSLGLERTGGFETVAFCEIEDFPRRVLAKHWPKVPCYNDVRDLTAERLNADGIAVDAICGGFPCQDISTAGLGAGLDGARSGLWSDFSRLISELAPRFVIVENVSALLGNGMGRVLGDLASIGYDAEWHCIPAWRVGAPHGRDRVWIVAYPAQELSDVLSHNDGGGLEREKVSQFGDSGWTSDVPNSEQGKQEVGRKAGRVGRIIQSIPRYRDWEITSEPVLGRGTNGIPNRVDRCGALGNAVVPQIPELIGRAILEERNER